MGQFLKEYTAKIEKENLYEISYIDDPILHLRAGPDLYRGIWGIKWGQIVTYGANIRDTKPGQLLYTYAEL